MSLVKIFETDKNNFYFTGYYDYDPISPCGSMLLALKVDEINRMPKATDRANVVLIDIENNHYKSLFATRTFNWQQGARTRWLRYSNQVCVVVNDRNENGYCTHIIDPCSAKIIKTIEKAVYQFSEDGMFGVILDHERYQYHRESYSYKGYEATSKKNDPAPHSDGIWITKTPFDEIKQIVSLGQLLSFKPVQTMQNALHYVEHMMFSPSGQKLVFFHRWKTVDGGRYTRIFLVGSNGKNLKLIHDSGRVGHVNWLDDETLIIYGSNETFATKLRKNRAIVKLLFKPLLPLYHRFVRDNSKFSKRLTGDGYFTLNTVTGQIHRCVGNINSEDGHPSAFDLSKSLIVTDSYGKQRLNGKHYAELIIFDLSTSKILTKLDIPTSSNLDGFGWRCDLHPKVVKSRPQQVVVDTCVKGKRGVAIYGFRP